MAKGPVKTAGTKHKLIIYIITAAAAAMLYLNALDGDFTYDDRLLLLENPDAYSLDRLPGHFTGKEGFFRTMGRYYRPLVAASYSLDFRIERMLPDPEPPEGVPAALFEGKNPYGFHVTNVIVHMAASVLLLHLLVLVVGNRSAAFLGALIFAAHPVHTEAVAWISGRTDSLACVFYLAAMIAHVRWTRGRGEDAGAPGGRAAARCGFVWMLVFYAAALLCKEMAVTFPLAVIAFDLTIGRWGRRDVGVEAGTAAASGAEADAPLGAFLRPRLRAYAALVAVTVVFLAVRALALQHVQNREGLLYFHGRETMTIVATMLQTLLVYGRLLVAPFDLVYDYGGTMPYLDSVLAPRALAGLAFAVLGLGFALYLRRRRPATAFALVFFFAALLPVMNIVPTMTLMAERFLYIPSIALSVIVADVLAMAWSTRARGALTAAAVAAAAVFGWMTYDRNDDWHDNTTLYRSAEGTPGTKLNVNLANLCAREGDLERAEELYNGALGINPNTMNAHLNLGLLYTKRFERATLAADQLEERGGYEGADSMRRTAEKHAAVALEHLGRARAIDPLSPDPIFVLYELSRLRGDLHECVLLLEEIQKVQPGYRQTDRLLQALKERLNG